MKKDKHTEDQEILKEFLEALCDEEDGEPSVKNFVRSIGKNMKKVQKEIEKSKKEYDEFGKI